MGAVPPAGTRAAVNPRSLALSLSLPLSLSLHIYLSEEEEEEEEDGQVSLTCRNV